MLGEFNLLYTIYTQMHVDGIYPLTERFGDIIYDVSGNGHHINIREILYNTGILSNTQTQDAIDAFWSLTQLK